VLVHGDGERWRSVTEDGGDDHGLYALAAELGGDRMAHVVQPGVGMQPGFDGQALERACE